VKVNKARVRSDGLDIQVGSQKPQRRVRRSGLLVLTKFPQRCGAHRCNERCSPGFQGENLVRAEGAAGNDDFAGDATLPLEVMMLALTMRCVCGSGHHRAMITHDVLFYLACQLSWVRDCGELRGCSSEVHTCVGLRWRTHSKHERDNSIYPGLCFSTLCPGV